MDVVVQLVVWLNAVANALGSWLLAPMAYVPGWLSATLVAAATGILLLVCFKYTSNQRAIKRVRDDINANLLALKLFKDNTRVALQAQGRLFLDAGRLFFLALVPVAVTLVPVILILGQLSLWYQQRPLRVGEEAVVTLKLNGDVFPEVSLQPTNAAQVTVGPVRVLSKREVCWNIKACRNGCHRLAFHVNGQTIDKELAVGNGFQRSQRPATGVELAGSVAAPLGESLHPKLRGSLDRDRLPKPNLVDERRRLVGGVLVCRVDGSGALFSPRAERQRVT